MPDARYWSSLRIYGTGVLLGDGVLRGDDTSSTW
jgi:hypothetical protein